MCISSWELSGAYSLRFTSSECPGVIDPSNPSSKENHQAGLNGILMVWSCSKAEILLCCYMRLPVAFFWMWDWVLTGRSHWLWSSEGPVELRPGRHFWVRSTLPLITDQCLHLGLSIFFFCCLHIVDLSSPKFTVFPLILLAPVLPSFLSVCPPAQPLRVTGSQRRSVTPLETCHWTWCVGSENGSTEYLHRFTKPGLTGSSYPVMLRGRKRARHSDGTAGIGRLQSTCLVWKAPTLSLPRDQPCSTVPAARWVFGRSVPYLWKTSSES